MKRNFIFGLAISTTVSTVNAAPPQSTSTQAQKSDTSAVSDQDDYLSDLARQLLRRRMARHGRDIGALSRAVIVLDRDGVARQASAIANEPRITRPGIGSGDELNAELPERFFVLQDELRSRAKALADAAIDARGDVLVQKYNDLTRTCVSCHQSFLERRARR